ncbi:hypothetical protein ACM66B_004506 [Microbotryomycetes sp. NB124-2]
MSLKTLLPLSPPMSDVELPGALSEFFDGSERQRKMSELSPPDTPDADARRKRRSSHQKHTKSQLSSSSSSRSSVYGDWPDNVARTDPCDRREKDEPDSPILPRVRLPFPAILSDDEDWPPVPSSSRRAYTSSSHTSSINGGRSISHETRSTTSTTHYKASSDRRSRRHAHSSMDAMFGSLDDLTRTGPPSATSTRPSSPRSQRTPLKSQASALRPDRPRSGSTSSVASTPRVRETAGTSTRRRKNSRASVGLHAPAAARPLDKKFKGQDLLSRAQSRAFNAHAFGQALSSGSHQLVKPFVTAFAVLFISTLACCSVFAVLASSYSLSMYDDCTHRFAQVQKGIGQGQRRIRGSIEGVKHGMGRMVGSASRALDLVVWVSGAKRIYVTRTPDATTDDSCTDSSTSEDDADTAKTPPRDNKTRPPFRRGRSSKTKPTNNSSQPAPEDLFGESERRRQRDGETWTDDEQPPFDVPPTTPFGSRPGSPHRPTLPPRPPLRVLIPSILFASLFVAFKLVRVLWTRQPSEPWRAYARKRSFQH